MEKTIYNNYLINEEKALMLWTTKRTDNNEFRQRLRGLSKKQILDFVLFGIDSRSKEDTIKLIKEIRINLNN